MPDQQARRRPIISLLTDFGLAGGYVGSMKAVILSRVEADIVDITHSVPPQAVSAGALILRSVAGYFPAGTVHVGVVDPGVGSSRKPIAVKSGGHFFVGPDNGLLIPAARSVGRPEVREIDVEKIGLGKVSRTFHGRDIFSPAAAYIASGGDFEKIGRKLRSWEEIELFSSRRLSNGITGSYICADSFGNMITSIAADEFLKVFSMDEKVSVDVGDSRHVLEFRSTYSEVAEGKPLILIGSHGNVEIAIRNGNAESYFKAKPGSEITFRKISF
jgi:S-adenosylmethionine hydrolase